MTKEKQIAELTHSILRNIVVDFYTSHAGPGIGRGGEIMKDVEELRLLMIEKRDDEGSDTTGDDQRTER